MTRVSNFAEAVEALAAFIPLTKEITGKDITLERMQPLMEATGNPEKRLKIVHVAGTSGKTSTSYYLASLLMATGRKVGLTVSPHIDSVTERAQINMQPLSETEFTAALDEYLSLIESAGIKPTYFEVLVSFAYWYFDKVRVDYAVIETGLGGLHDATNVAQDPNKICVITDIGLDHMHVLGKTVPEIAAQKAGIIHPKNEVFIYDQAEEIMNVIEQTCQSKAAKLHVLNELSLLAEQNIEGLPPFQTRNWLLAHHVYEHLRARDNLHEISQEKLIQTTRICVPARMDEATVQGKKVIMDGAHNEQKMQAFVAGFRAKYGDKKVPILLSLKLGKEFLAVLPLLRPITSELIITAYQFSQDLPIPSINPDELAAAAQKMNFDKVSVEPKPDLAYKQLLEKTTDVGVITGSFYLIAQLRLTREELKSEQTN